MSEPDADVVVIGPDVNAGGLEIDVAGIGSDDVVYETDKIARGSGVEDVSGTDVDVNGPDVNVLGSEDVVKR